MNDTIVHDCGGAVPCFCGADRCADGHELVYDTVHYETPRWVHASIADLMACTAWHTVELGYADGESYTGQHRVQ